VADQQIDISGFHGVFWAVTGVAIAAFVISLVIRRHSIDKLLESKFILEGGQTPKQALSQTPSQLVSITSDGPTPSMSDAESTFKDHSQDSVGTPNDTTNELGSNNDANAGMVMVAYYAEPGGRVIPVDIIYGEEVEYPLSELRTPKLAQGTQSSDPRCRELLQKAGTLDRIQVDPTTGRLQLSPVQREMQEAVVAGLRPGKR
jgi:hypothetical protein